MTTLLPASFLGLLLSFQALTAANDIPFIPTPDRNPHGVATDGEYLWVADRSARLLSKLNPASGEVLDEIDLNTAPGKPNPRGITMMGDELWFVSGAAVYSVDLDTKQVTEEFAGHGRYDPPQIDLLGSNIGLSFDGTHLWIATTAQWVYRVDPATGVISRSFALGFDAWGLGWHADHLWALNGSVLQRHDPESGAREEFWPTYGGATRGMAWLDGSFWIGERKTATIQRFGLPTPAEYNSSVWLTRGRFPLVEDEDQLPDGVLVPELPYACSHSLHQGASHPAVKRILVSQHGVGSGAAHYFVAAMVAARRADVLFAEHAPNDFAPPEGIRKYSGETLVVSAQFINRGDLDGHHPVTVARWSGGKFWGKLCDGDLPEGDPALQSGDLLRTGSFKALDLLLHHITSQCPNLEELVVAGHSGGGQFAQRYAATSPFEDDLRAERPAVRVRYVPMNAGSYVYLDAKRFDPDTLFLSPDHEGETIQFIDPFIPSSYSSYFPDQSDHPPANYNDYGKGLDLPGDKGDIYPDVPDAATVRNRFKHRCVAILIGEEDNDPVDASLPTNNGDYVQGPHRLARAKIFHAHLRDTFGPENVKSHSLTIVPGVGHNGAGTMLSEEGLTYLFLHRCDGFDAKMVELVGSLVPPHKRLPRADLDGDGISNLYEVSANLPPHVPNGPNDHPRFHLVTVGGSIIPALTVRRHTGDLPIRGSLLYSADLRRWSSESQVHSRRTLDRRTEEITLIPEISLPSESGFLQWKTEWQGTDPEAVGGPQ